MENTTLRVLQNERLIFESERRWLMPLFDFEAFLQTQPDLHGPFKFHDKVIGKAAALLMLRLGAAAVHGEVMSRLAVDLLDKHAVPNTHHTLVERIDCQTEEILLAIDDLDQAYVLLAERAQHSAS
ncbi:MAG: hypothetical protein PWQ55_2102 [Chloroflexota bacterium]|nr:hypothetical protein [Chloroflexota bacterium]